MHVLYRTGMTEFAPGCQGVLSRGKDVERSALDNGCPGGPPPTFPLTPALAASPQHPDSRFLAVRLVCVSVNKRSPCTKFSVSEDRAIIITPK